MKTNREKIDKKLRRLKKSMEVLPEDDKVFIGWGLLSDVLKSNCKGVIWVYGELGRLMVRKFKK